MPQPQEEPLVEYFLYTGTYTTQGGRGIVLAQFSSADGRLETLGLVAELENPSFLCVSTSRNALVAVSEVGKFRGQRSGSVSSWKIDSRTGRLLCLGQKSSEGSVPCHVSLDRTENVVMVANYGVGSVATFHLDSDGTLGEAASVHRQTGNSINIHRQSSSHAHGAFVAPANQYVVVPDLGADLLYIYSLDVNSAKLRPSCPATVPVEAGTGPRHFAFHPRGEFGYVIGELNSSIVGFCCSLDGTSIHSFMNAPTTACEFNGENIASEIAIDRSGRFLYCSNRGADDIAVFAIGPNGELTPRQRIGSGGRTPRHFALDPTETFILVANQDSDNVAVFSRDRVTGLLNDTGRRLQVSQPACLAFASRAG